MKILAIASSLLRIIGEIARSPSLAEIRDAKKFGDTVAGLTDTASLLLERGEEGIEALREFKNHVKALRDQLAAGTLTSEQFLGELSALRSRSDAAHQGLQDLKPPPAGGGGTAETEGAPAAPAAAGGATDAAVEK